MTNLVNSLSDAATILSTVTNTLMTLFLAGRLIWLGRKYRQCFGALNDISIYVSPAAIIIESALLYTIPQLIASIIDMVTHGTQSEIPIGLAVLFSVSSPSHNIHIRMNFITRPFPRF